MEKNMGLLYPLSFVIFVIVSEFSFATVPHCSGEKCGTCNVKTTSHDVIVTCTGNNITQVPDDLPANTTKL